MKPGKKRPSKTIKAAKRKSIARPAIDAISKKVEEIKKESAHAHTVTNNMSLFGYRV